MAATTPAANPISGINLATAAPVADGVAAAAVLVAGGVVEAAAEEETDAPAPDFTVVGGINGSQARRDGVNTGGAVLGGGKWNEEE
ncbi:MAG: hypothetical protein Q9195_002038 [Heterodermia aff. obscurata]